MTDATSPYLRRPLRSLDDLPLYRWRIEWRGPDGWDYVTVTARSEAGARERGAEDACLPNYVVPSSIRVTRLERIEQQRSAA